MVVKLIGNYLINFFFIQLVISIFHRIFMIN